MKKIILVLTFLLMQTTYASACCVIEPIPAPLPHQSIAQSSGTPLINPITVGLTTLFIAAIIYDKEQECDKLPITVGSTGNYTYDVTGCE